MNHAIQPDYFVCKVTCSCGNTFTTRSTREELRVDICGQCHPYYTGRQKFVDTAGRIQRFQEKYSWKEDTVQKKAKEKGAPKKPKTAPKSDED